MHFENVSATGGLSRYGDLELRVALPPARTLFSSILNRSASRFLPATICPLMVRRPPVSIVRSGYTPGRSGDEGGCWSQGRPLMRPSLHPWDNMGAGRSTPVSECVILPGVSKGISHTLLVSALLGRVVARRRPMVAERARRLSARPAGEPIEARLPQLVAITVVVIVVVLQAVVVIVVVVVPTALLLPPLL